MRMFLGAVLALLVSVNGLSAAEIKGKIAKIDADKGLLTVNVDGQDKQFQVPAEATCACPFGMKMPAGLKAEFRVQVDGKTKTIRLFREGGLVKITTVSKDGKEVVEKVQTCVK